MITQTENEKLILMIGEYGYLYQENKVNDAVNKAYEIIAYLDSITEKPKAYYAVNFNPIGCLPESEPHDGLETIDDIMDAIDDIAYEFEYHEGIDPNLELPEKSTIKRQLTFLLDRGTLDHFTIGYIGNFAIFVYKDDEYEYRQSK